MPVYFYQGKPLIRGGKVAVDEACCCGPECCCGPCIRFRWVIQGVTPITTCDGCDDVNSTGGWITGDIFPTIEDGVCTYEATLDPDPNPLAGCEDFSFSLKAKITCPVEGGIRVESSVQIGLIVAPPPAPGDPPLTGVPHFILDEVVEDCDDYSQSLGRSGTPSNVCDIDTATITLSIEPCLSALAFVDPAGVPYESPDGDNYLAPNTASVSVQQPRPALVAKPTQLKRQPRPKRKRARRAKRLPILQCKHQGEVLGRADCSCGHKPDVFHCELLDAPCVQRSPAKPIVKLQGGQRIDRPHVCKLCEHYEAGTQ